MSATAWFIIAIVGFSLAGLALAAAVILFIKMNIPAIIGDLTGKTVAREIKAMRESNASGGDKRFRSSAVNLERGALTAEAPKGSLSTDDLKTVHASKRLDKTGGLGKTGAPKGETAGLGDGTAPIALSVTEGTEVLSNATEVLTPETEVLSPETEVLSDGTTVLGGTTVLSGTEELNTECAKPVAFRVVRSIVLVQSDEVIA